MPARSTPPGIPPEEWPDGPALRRLADAARGVAAHVRICLQRRAWQGTVGNWAGAGIGSSIDFQDHRPYLPGDDPRYIDWAAYARSGHYIMKLYREEVSPRVDLLLDVSRSMTATLEKRETMLSLAVFAVESAMQHGASLRAWAVAGSFAAELSADALAAGRWDRPGIPRGAGAPEWSLVPMRPGSLRIAVSDLLYPRPPAALVKDLAAARGRAAILAPYSEAESVPVWSGNVEFVDCETGERRRQRADHDLAAAYASAYRLHLAQWRDAARRHDARLARVPCGRPLGEALRAEALPQGVVEPWA